MYCCRNVCYCKDATPTAGSHGEKPTLWLSELSLHVVGVRTISRRSLSHVDANEVVSDA